jgi:hypothetical protein
MQDLDPVLAAIVHAQWIEHLQSLLAVSPQPMAFTHMRLASPAWPAMAIILHVFAVSVPAKVHEIPFGTF